MHQEPYRGETLQSADPSRVVFVCQSKADADVLSSLDCLATYAPSWANGISGGLWNRVVVAIAPDDDAGRDFAYSTHACLAANAKNFRYLLIDRVPEGRTVGEYLRLLDKADTRKMLKGMVAPLLEKPQELPESPYIEPELEADPAPSREPWVQPVGSYEDVVAWPEPLDIFRDAPVPTLRGEYLPDPIIDYVVDQSTNVGADPGVLALSCIVCCASVIHDGIKIQPKQFDTGWTESARLWGAIVGKPSVRKSPAMDKALKPMRGLNADLAQKNKQARAQWANECKDAKANKEQEPEGPPELRAVVSDVTLEKLQLLVASNPRGMLQHRSELAGWFGTMDAYRSGTTGRDQAAYLEAYDGGPQIVDRMSRDTLFIENWSVCMLGSIQPSKIRQIAKNLSDDGLLQRFMVVNATMVRFDPQDRVPNAGALKTYYDLIKNLHAIEPCDEYVQIERAGIELRQTFERDMLSLADTDVLPERMRSAVAKWVGLWPRLALTYHCIECSQERVHPTNRFVSLETCQQVDKFLRNYLMGHTYAFYMNVLAGSEYHDHAKWIAGYCLANGVTVIDNRTIQQHYKAWKNVPEWGRTSTWRLLEDCGWLNPVVTTNRAKITTYAVNPKAAGMFEDEAKKQMERRKQARELIVEAGENRVKNSTNVNNDEDE